MVEIGKSKLSIGNTHIKKGRAEHNSTIAMQGLQSLLREAIEQILLFHIRGFLVIRGAKAYTYRKFRNRLLICK